MTIGKVSVDTKSELRVKGRQNPRNKKTEGMIRRKLAKNRMMFVGREMQTHYG